MTHSQGFRCKTRKVFARAFREHGRTAGSVLGHLYRRGDRVEIMVNGSVHKGMPHRYYHGKGGVVFNVNPRAIGVEVNKRVGTRIMKKRLHIRVEHLRPSKCADNHIARVQANEAAKKDKNTRVCMKRINTQPAAAVVVAAPKIVDIAPVPFSGVYI